MDKNQAREYFANKGLTYGDISEGDVCVLVMLLNKHIKRACAKFAMSTDTMRMSQKIKSTFNANGEMKECYLFINSHYFKQRECISFNRDGFIGFCGWADLRNTAPIVAAFIEWCDGITKTGNEEAADGQGQ